MQNLDCVETAHSDAGAAERIVVEIRMPFPHKDLGQNGRGLRQALDAKRKKARGDAYRYTLAALPARHPWRNGKVPERLRYSLKFYPPGRYRYDDDNLIGRTKCLRDGIADALGIDDNRLEFDRLELFGPLAVGPWYERKVGVVVFVIEAAQ